MTQDNDFLPSDYAVPPSENKYVKYVQGDNKFRIMDKPIFGWEAWKVEEGKDKPVRFEMDNKPIDLREFKEQKISHFWAMPVWNFQTKGIQVLQITQKGIQEALESLARNEDWGSPLTYNITINKKGEKLKTEYQVHPSPHTEAPLDAQEAYAEAVKNGFDITRLFTNDDPFTAPSETE